MSAEESTGPFRIVKSGLGVVAHTLTQEAEADWSQRSRSAWSTELVPSSTGRATQRNSVSKNQKRKKKKDVKSEFDTKRSTLYNEY